MILSSRGSFYDTQPLVEEPLVAQSLRLARYITHILVHARAPISATSLNRRLSNFVLVLRSLAAEAPPLCLTTYSQHLGLVLLLLQSSTTAIVIMMLRVAVQASQL